MADEIRTIKLEPEWEQTCAFFAIGLADHQFERGAYEVAVSLIEQVRYLAITDPAALERVMARVKGGR